ncbi:hypothetical protein H4R34_002414 [Dimargaris verticillata]|uniref:S-adenosyl-L-methionine-dependent methyltransferase n=1 Tax=Dimargaris verticillata TaxID=2761393 RepID=A0A9W8B475_9FUNG|nr:hypothetical protein H4R34_002414 [Dimargaris verticillata]
MLALTVVHARAWLHAQSMAQQMRLVDAKSLQGPDKVASAINQRLQLTEAYCWDHSSPRPRAPGIALDSPAANDGTPFSNSIDPSLDHIEQLRQACQHRCPEIRGVMIPRLHGLMLYWLVTLLKPRRVLEVESFVGYSLMWLTEAIHHTLRQSQQVQPNQPCQLPAEPPVVGCELVPEYVALIRHHLQTHQLDKLARIVQGRALDTLKHKLNTAQPFDLVFIDTNKAQYIDYYDTALDQGLLAPGGLIIVDNTLMHSRVHSQYPPVQQVLAEINRDGPNSSDYVEPTYCLTEDQAQQAAQQVYQFNQHVANDSRTEQLLMPIFDGFTLIRRKLTRA